MINKKVIRRPIEKGKFTTIQHSILKDKRLSSDDKIILTSILADADNFNVTHELLLNRFDLSENTLRKIFKNLEQCGYLKRTKMKRGNYYTISEFGNLNGTTTDSKTETVVPPTVYEEEPPPNKEQLNELDKFNNLYNTYRQSINGYLKYEQISKEVTKITLDAIHNDIIDFYVIKRDLEKYIYKITTGYFNKAFAFTKESPTNSTNAAINAYKKWLKEQIFDRQQLDIKYETTWLTLKNRHRKSFDAETEYADRLEQMLEDGEGND